VAVALPGVSVLASCNSVGEPGPPVAILGTGSSSLDRLAVLTCPGERVLRVAIARDIGNPIAVPGATLWSIQSDGSSAASQFAVAGPPPPGFKVVVPATGPLSGRVVVLVTTTHESFVAPFLVGHLAADRLLHAGRTFTADHLPSFTRERCGK
jgi:hypothetical protein